MIFSQAMQFFGRVRMAASGIDVPAVSQVLRGEFQTEPAIRAGKSEQTALGIPHAFSETSRSAFQARMSLLTEPGQAQFAEDPTPSLVRVTR